MYGLEINMSYNELLARVEDKCGCEAQIEILHRMGVNLPLGKMILSPFRKEKHPSCKLLYNKGVLILYDYGSRSSYSVYEILVRLGVIADFRDMVLSIVRTFDLDISKNIPTHAFRSDLSASVKRQGLASTKRKSTRMRVRFASWRKKDIDFWKQYGITLRTLVKFKVVRVSHVWFNDNPNPMRIEAYAYWFGDEEWKIYMPWRQAGQNRFYCNSRRIQGFDQLPDESEYIVITKSLKDVMTLYEFGIPAIAPQSESSVFSLDEIDALHQRFDAIYSFYDFDRAGVSGANALRKSYGITPFFLTNGRFSTHNYGAKDISDYHKRYGRHAAQLLITKAKDILGTSRPADTCSIKQVTTPKILSSWV